MAKIKMALLMAGLMGSALAVPPAGAQTTTATPAPAPAPAPAASNDAGKPPAPAPQAAPPAPATQAPGSAKADAGPKGPTPAQTRLHDRVAFFNARIAALHAGLMLDGEQQKLWPPLEQGIRDLARARMQEARIASEGRRVIDDETTSGTDAKPFDLLKQTGEQFERHGRALQALAESAQPLFATLTEEQKNRLPVLIDGLTPRRGPMARLLAMIAPSHQSARDDEDRGDDRHGQDHYSDRDQDHDRMSAEDRSSAWHRHGAEEDWDRDRTDRDRTEHDRPRRDDGEQDDGG